jgi:hypothetical protein
MTEQLTDEQRVELRRGILQSIGEIDRGLTLADRQLKAGRFMDARDTITGIRGLLGLHESLSRRLLDENRDLREEVEEYSNIMMAQGRILSQAADAFHGGPNPRGSWSHHDVGERAEQVMKELAEARS